MAELISKKPELLKSILDMKFMKKTKERLENEKAFSILKTDKLSSAVPNEIGNSTDNFISQSSYLFCEDLIEGRLSFKGMNPEIERLMELENPTESTVGEMDKDISDEVLAKKMAQFNKRKRENDTTPNKHPATKRRR